MDENAIHHLNNMLSRIEVALNKANATRERESKALLQQLEKLTDAIRQHGQRQQSEEPAPESQRGA
jgi:hypothetical protein